MEYIIIALLFIIAIGVLLISEDGKRFLRGSIKVSGAIGKMCLVLLIIIGVFSLISDSWEPIRNFLFAIPGLIILLLVYATIFFIIPTYINKLLKTGKKQTIFWSIIGICFFSWLIHISFFWVPII